MEILTPCKIETLEQIDTQFVRIDYVHERNACSKFGKNKCKNYSLSTTYNGEMTHRKQQ